MARLEPPQIMFLLNSFLARVVSALSLFGTKKGRPHSKTTPSSSSPSQLSGTHTPATVAQLAVTLLPAFCNHLETASAFFQVCQLSLVHSNRSPRPAKKYSQNFVKIFILFLVGIGEPITVHCQLSLVPSPYFHSNFHSEGFPFEQKLEWNKGTGYEAIAKWWTT